MARERRERSTESKSGTSRRNVLGLIATGAVSASVAATVPVTAQDAGSNVDEYALRYGDECVTITPLRSGDEPVESFYGYEQDLDEDDPRQSNLPGSVEQPAASRLFLYRDPDGLSLVFVHGGDSDPGGSATFEISGLSDDVEWLVQDDGYEGAADRFETGDGTATADWRWGFSGRNDGGALGYLGDEFAIRVEPRFDDAAERAPFDGEDAGVEQWQVLSGDVADPDIVTAAMDQPIELVSGSCGSPAAGGPDPGS